MAKGIGLISEVNQIENIRERIAGLKAMQKELHTAPRTTAEAIASTTASLDQVATEVARIPFGEMLHARESNLRDAVRLMEQLPPVHFMVALFGAEEVKKRFRTLIEANPPAGGVADSEHAKRMNELADKLSAAEREEETLIRSLESVSVNVDRRPDADPSIVLAA